MYMVGVNKIDNPGLVVHKFKSYEDWNPYPWKLK